MRPTIRRFLTSSIISFRSPCCHYRLPAHRYLHSARLSLSAADAVKAATHTDADADGDTAIDDTHNDASSSLPPRESLSYDVVIVGGGPSGLSAAIRLKQLCQQHSLDLSVCVLEKGSEIGAHILSGCVLEPRTLNELIPDWKEKAAPVHTAVTSDQLLFLTQNSSFPLPTPPTLNNHGNYIISLSQLTKWLASQAESLGVEIYPGFSAASVLYDEKKQSVRGVITADVGIDKAGKRKSTYSRGMEIIGAQTLFAEGCRGSNSEALIQQFQLREQKKSDPQTYGLGIKEFWEIPASQHQPGLVVHTLGWPAPTDTWFGTFMYHLSNDDPANTDTGRVLIGAVVGLDYPNPYLSPYHTFQQWKLHPSIKAYLMNGKCIQYGARCINEGGYQSIPKLTFNGGMLIGCSAGFLNVPKIKGTHTAMKSGMVAAEAIVEAALASKSSAAATSSSAAAAALQQRELTSYQSMMENSWVWSELKSVRNYHPSYHRFGGLYGFMLYSGLQSFILRGKEPWTFRNTQQLRDDEYTKTAAQSKPISYPPADGILTFDLLTNLQRSGVTHEEDQPSHLQIKPGMENVPLSVSLKEYAGPEQRFCPAKVYEYIPIENDTGVEGVDDRGSQYRLQINSSNCVHCKSCDIKTPKQFIHWTVPEGGGGPN